MTVEQLARQLGITIKEALALCLVAGVKARDASSRLGPADVDAVRRVLAGEKKLVDPTRPGGTGYVKRRSGKEAVIAAVVIGIVVLVLLAVALLPRLVGETKITVAAGECFDAVVFGGTTFGSSITPEPCDQAGFRAFAVLDLDEVWTTWPGVEAVEERAKQRCAAIAQGLDVDAFTIYYFGPADEAAWASPDARKIVCAEPT